MADIPTQMAQLPQKRSFGRIVLALLLGLFAGWATWSWVGTYFEVQPLYQIKSTYGMRCQAIGPWLCSSERRENEGQAVDTFRLLATGQLVGQYEQSLLLKCKFLHVIDHPELGKDTLVGVNPSNRQQYLLVLYQPRTGENRVVRRWNGMDTYFELSHSGRYFMEQRTLQLTPLLQWGITGLPDMIREEFYRYLSIDGALYTTSSVALVRVYSTMDGRLLGECTLPSQTGIYPIARLLDNGEQLAITFRTYSDKLGYYFLAKITPDEDQTKLASIMPGLILMNFRTGQIVRQWPGLGDCSLDRVSNQMWLHRCNNIPPLMHWASSRPDKVQFRLLDSQTRQLIDLERPQNHHIEEAKQGPTGYQMFAYHHDLDTQHRCIQSKLLCTTIDSTGKVLSRSSLSMEGSANGQLINNQRQMTVYQDLSQGWHQIWRSWTVRWPWLNNIYQPYSGRWFVWDIDTNEKHLVTTSRVSMYWASPDGCFLLVGEGANNHVEVLSVYALPFLPQALWAYWIPRLAGVLTSLLFFWICLVIFGRQRKQMEARHSLKSA